MVKEAFEVRLIDDGTMDTVLEVNGQEVRFDTEAYADCRDNEGNITAEGWKILKEEAIEAYVETNEIDNREEKEF